MTLSNEQMDDILSNGAISSCTETEKKQVFEYAFGAEFMASNDKGQKKQYVEK